MISDRSGGSVTLWIRSLKAGDERAASSLWRRYFDTLVRLARGRLRNAPRTVSDEEDVALSAFHCLCRGATAGRFPRLDDRNNLWRLLTTIVSQKAVDQRRQQGRAKRGGGRGIVATDLNQDGDPLALVAGRQPGPEVAAASDEDYQNLLRRLGDDELRRIAAWKLEGRDNDEIARRLGCSPRTLRRRLGEIREACILDRHLRGE
ncbi:ECF-type sigma factor [Aquisphaera insulae]|uniref:ECF-type sigma factor n=1 Tax=Aquisphaera insulae TaxID=2712864 RepID=UPI0013EBE297|nr:ECF-type sigma factor [Aquisphaera insulae]